MIGVRADAKMRIRGALAPLFRGDLGKRTHRRNRAVTKPREAGRMPAHLRVSLADRPGALATLTRALAAAGANVLSVTVLQRESGRAVDDLLLEWPFERPWDHVVRAVEGCAGARLHGLRHVSTTELPPDTTP